ncbi:uncharacterized protein LOC130784270 isoform X2 [Actinidia eriantha]|uniref:uncharacterized protein LOC130784270 isoform X2 n=1 Tax=Actinidia eriantha TaxID=165200 RepID=UPI00258BEBFB|nr:uncharacterized protein LOC130784270 isoform X2 [Actinidia eriantha]
MLLSFIKYLCDLCVSFLVSFLNIQIFNLIFCIIVSGFLERFKLSISETPTNTTIEEAMYYATNPQTHKPREILFDWGNFSLWLMEITTDTHKVPDIPESGKNVALSFKWNVQAKYACSSSWLGLMIRFNISADLVDQAMDAVGDLGVDEVYGYKAALME